MIKKQYGFTLAEVLITLAIIGVVAAMTIPTLVANYQNKAWNTSASVFERKLEEALKSMNSQQTLAGHTSTKNFVTALSGHFKINKICDTNDIASCFKSEISWPVIDIAKGGEINNPVNITTIKTANDLVKENWDTEALGVQFANGITGIIAYNPECKQNPYSNQITGAECIALIYDTNGFKTPNINGKDIRAINATLGGNCSFKINGTCFKEIFRASTELTRKECEEQKSTLGIKECHPDRDFWGGAVKTCGGVDKLPNQEQALAIIKYIYNVDDNDFITGDSRYEYSKYTIATRDDKKMQELGMTVSSTSSFYLWSGIEYNNRGAYEIGLHSNRGSFGVSTCSRNCSAHAICIGN